MNAYLASVIENVKAKHGNEPEFVQTVEEVFSSLEPVIEKHPEYEKVDLLGRMVEPERMFTFRVVWCDDNGQWHTNRGWRCQFNGAIGPYKGGLRFQKNVYEGIIKFLGFEQTFKNSLTGLPIGGAKGGSDFDPAGKSDAEVMRFCQSFMTALYRYIGPDVDVPAGDMGVGGREIGYLYGQYRRLKGVWENGVLTGKGLSYGGSLIRPEATGYGAIYYLQEVLKHENDKIEGKKIAISGYGNVGWGIMKKAAQLGAAVTYFAGPDGYVHDPDGVVTDEKLNFILEMRAKDPMHCKPYADKFGCEFVAGEKCWGVKDVDVYMPAAMQNDVKMESAEKIAASGVKYYIEVANMPKTMGTTAVDAASGTHEGQARDDLAIVDVVEYTGCIPGDEYTVEGVLMDAETDEPALDDDGNEITAQATFVAEDFTGSVEMIFAFSGVGLAGTKLVAFETMTCGGEEYMVHADIEDGGQTVAVVDIATTAVNPETGDATGIAGEEVELVDTVEYTGLTPGNTYTMTGHIADAETGELLMDGDGNAYVQEVAFSPEEADGTVEVAFEIDASSLSGKTTVFTETLSDSEGNIIAVHDDMADADQSIYFPAIRTTAVDGADGDKNLVAGESATVVDTVFYENLIPGKEYVVSGVLMDKATGEPLKDAQGNGVSASAAFTPESPDGEVEVAFGFDATGLAGKSAVAFESLVKDGIEVAVHADIDDEAQTVAIVEPEEEAPGEEASGKGYPKTGAAATAAAAGAGGIALAAYGLAGAASGLLKRRKDAADGQGEDA